MGKSMAREGFIVEVPRDIIRRGALKDGDWLRVRLLNGREVVLSKPGKDYWDETFSWGRKFAKENKIKAGDILKAIKELRSGK